MKRTVCIALLLAVAPFARADLVEVAPDLYLLTRSGRFANHVEIKLAAIREANAFAKEKGRVALPVSGREYLPAGQFSPSIFEYQFRLVSEEEARRSRATLADVVIATTGRSSGADVYSELVRLDVLRERGILTAEEFAQRKKRVLEEDDDGPAPASPAPAN